MAGMTIVQMVCLSQELTAHLKNVHMHNTKASGELEKATKVLWELLNSYNLWQLEPMGEEQEP